MSAVFDHLTLLDVHEDVFRNVVSLRQSQDLFDDLTDDPAGWALAQNVEAEVKPPPYLSSVPVIDRPFEDAVWFNAIQWPFFHWRASRFSDGSFGVWYGSQSVATTVHESVWHWYGGLLADAGFQHESVVAERKVFVVACDAALIDLRPVTPEHPGLVHPTDYALPQSVGERMHREGHPGLLTRSARDPKGTNIVVFNARVLSNPRHLHYLTYRLADGLVHIEKDPGVPCMTIEATALGDGLNRHP